MSSLEFLSAFRSEWKGASALLLSPQEDVRESISNLSLTPILKGKFIEVKYTWSYDDKPQEGMLLIGYQTDRQLATAVWFDSWHMGEKFMNCQGVVRENGAIDVRGFYQVSTGPDWGWRIVLEPASEKVLHLVMYNIWPGGDEELAVKAEYTPLTG